MTDPTPTVARSGDPRAAEPAPDAPTLDELAPSAVVLRLYRRVFGVLAGRAEAMIVDPDSLDVDEAILRSFADSGSDGLTHEQVRNACRRFPGAEIDRRFELLLGYGAITKLVERPNERRYRASFAPYVMVAFLRRMAERGGQSELHHLLTVEQIGVQAEEATPADGACAVRRWTDVFRLLANELTGLTVRGSVEQLRESAQLLWGNRELIERAEQVHAVVLDRWPELDRDCARLRMAFAAYGDAVEAAAGRLVERAGTTRALGLLPAERWVTFARRSDAARLAAVLDDLVFDAPGPWFDPQEITEAVATGRFEVDTRRPPPRADAAGPVPAPSPATDDAERIRASCEESLAGRADVSLVDLLEGAGDWAAARRILGDLTAAHHHPELPYELVWGQHSRTAPGGTPAWATEGTFRRVPDVEGAPVA